MRPPCNCCALATSRRGDPARMDGDEDLSAGKPESLEGGWAGNLVAGVCSSPWDEPELYGSVITDGEAECGATLGMEVGTEDIRDCDGIWGGGVLSICSACSLIQTSDKAAVTKERDGKRWVENDALCGIISESFGTSSLLSGCGGLKTSWSSASRSKLIETPLTGLSTDFREPKGRQMPTSSFFFGTEKGSVADTAVSHMISIKTGKRRLKPTAMTMFRGALISRPLQFKPWNKRISIGVLASWRFPCQAQWHHIDVSFKFVFDMLRMDKGKLRSRVEMAGDNILAQWQVPCSAVRCC